MLLLIFSLDAIVRYIPYIEVVGIFRGGGETRFGLLSDVVSQYVFILPAVILCAFVWKLPFLTTYIVMLAADDISKLALTIPYYKSMRWVKPIESAPAPMPDSQEILLQNGDESGIL
jgi:Na+-driven multidrug efflux pump